MRHGLMGSERRRKDGCKGQYKGTYRQQCLNDKEGDNNSKKKKKGKEKKETGLETIDGRWVTDWRK